MNCGSTDSGGAVAPESATARELLRLEDVTRTFPTKPPVRALRHVSFSVERGELLGVVGRSGSGKSTLLNVIGLLDRFDAGSYAIAGIDVASLGERAQTDLRARFFGFVFQQAFLLQTHTAQENVELALRPQRLDRAERRRRATEALEHVGLEERRHFLPATLSGGECQRVAIARALATTPDVLLCDEPTGNLDEQTTATVLGLLLEARKLGVTVILVTHDLAIARALPRVLTVRDGVVTEGLSQFVSATSTLQRTSADA